MNEGFEGFWFAYFFANVSVASEAAYICNAKITLAITEFN